MRFRQFVQEAVAILEGEEQPAEEPIESFAHDSPGGRDEHLQHDVGGLQQGRHWATRDADFQIIEFIEQTAHAFLRESGVIVGIAVEKEQKRHLGIEIAPRLEYALEFGGNPVGVMHMFEHCVTDHGVDAVVFER